MKVATIFAVLVVILSLVDAISVGRSRCSGDTKIKSDVNAAGAVVGGPSRCGFSSPKTAKQLRKLRNRRNKLKRKNSFDGSQSNGFGFDRQFGRKNSFDDSEGNDFDVSRQFGRRTSYDASQSNDFAHRRQFGRRNSFGGSQSGNDFGFPRKGRFPKPSPASDESEEKEYESGEQ